VCFRGAADHAALPRLYRDAGVFIVSSRHEAQCMVALEAAACGIPVVGTNVGVLPEVTVSGARTVPVGDAGGLAVAISSAIANDKGVGGSLASFVQNEFSLEASANRFRSVYAALARG
jgi:glycosyltransferase involved in cell wall biosynthesis